jgi:hypothetical protein
LPQSCDVTQGLPAGGLALAPALGAAEADGGALGAGAPVALLDSAPTGESGGSVASGIGAVGGVDEHAAIPIPATRTIPSTTTRTIFIERAVYAEIPARAAPPETACATSSTVSAWSPIAWRRRR